MNRVRIVTDSTADLPRALVEEYGISVVPLKVIFKGEEPLKDGVDIDTGQFYQRQVDRKESSGTSQPSPADFAAVYGKLAEKGNSIISIHLSSALSGTFQSARLAAETMPGADIVVIDSRSVSMGLGLLALEAARAAEQGQSKQEILDLVREILPKIQVFFIVDSLEYLMRGGRIGKAQAFIGTILNIKPLLYLEEGLVHPYEKVRGKARAIDRLIQIAEEKAADKKTIKCSLVHGMDPSGLEQLRQKITTRLNLQELIIAQLGAVVGTHTGPGVLGIVFLPE